MKSQSVTANDTAVSAPHFSINPAKLLSSIVDVICAIGEDGIFRYVNPSCTHLFGYSSQEMTGISFRRFIHPADLHKVAAVVHGKQHDSSTSNFESRFLKKDNTVVHLLWSVRWDEYDRLFYCVARDGTEKRTVEQRLMKAQQMARVANYEFDVLSNTYLYASDTLFEIFGLDQQEHSAFTSELFWSLVHPDDAGRVKEDIRQLGNLYSSMLEFRIVRPDGQVVHVSRMREAVRNEAGQVVKTIGTIQEITDRKIGELALQQSEERLRSLVQNGNDLIGILDASANYVFVGANVKEQLGYTVEDFIGKNALDFIHPDDAGKLADLLPTIATRKTISIAPFRFRNSKGEWLWMETTISNHLANPAIGGLVTNSKDVTEKKLKDDALALSQQRFKALVQHGSDLIVVIDEHANFIYCSDNTLLLLGYAPNELTGRNAFDFIHASDKQKVMEEIEAVLQNPQNAKGVQHRFLHKNGEWLWLESKGTDHLQTHSINGILVNSRNITDRVLLQKRLNRELVNKQKEITAAVIKAQETERSQLGLELHDNVNQILTTVKLYTEMYLTGYVADKELLVKSAQYTQDCINEIRSISKRLSAPTLGSISVQDSIQELIESINLTRRLEIIYSPQGLGQCCITEDLHLAIYRIVQEALNNIIKYSHAKVATIELVRKDAHLHLVIRDDGKGFDTAAKNVGIGITNMKTRAENLHGEFSLRSTPGKGCEIAISFPCGDGSVLEKKKQSIY